jgi:uncharacterized protein (TIGR00251 family)
LKEAPQSTIPLPARETADGLVIAVRLTPKAGRDQLFDVNQDAAGHAHLAARVKALPEDGKANAALEALLAKWLDIPKSHCEVVSGGRSRLKQVLARGDSRLLAERLRAGIQQLQSGG